jgi:hypothetical protein
VKFAGQWKLSAHFAVLSNVAIPTSQAGCLGHFVRNSVIQFDNDSGMHITLIAIGMDAGFVGQPHQFCANRKKLKI